MNSLPQTFLVLSSFLGLSTPVLAQESDFPPNEFEPSSYQSIWQLHPFILEVNEPAPIEKIDDWADGIFVRAVNRIDGKYVVHIEDTKLANERDSKKARHRFQRLVEDSSDELASGLYLVEVKAHRDPLQVEVVIAKLEGQDSKQATVKYDPKLLSANLRKTGKRITHVVTPRTPTPNQSGGTKNRKVVMPPGLRR